jgi:hypothetical protein
MKNPLILEVQYPNFDHPTVFSWHRKVSTTGLDALDAPSNITFEDLDPLAGTVQGDLRSSKCWWMISNSRRWASIGKNFSSDPLGILGNGSHSV